TRFKCDGSSDECSSHLTDTHTDTHTDIFSQAEDGIRDSSVTGVQTCALPISHTHTHTHTHTHKHLDTQIEKCREIGRASCRERVEISVGAVYIKKNRVHV